MNKLTKLFILFIAILLCTGIFAIISSDTTPPSHEIEVILPTDKMEFKKN